MIIVKKNWTLTQHEEIWTKTPNNVQKNALGLQELYFLETTWAARHYLKYNFIIRSLIILCSLET